MRTREFVASEPHPPQKEEGEWKKTRFVCAQTKKRIKTRSGQGTYICTYVLVGHPSAWWFFRAAEEPPLLLTSITPYLSLSPVTPLTAHL